MKKPIIGILPLYDMKMESLWMLPLYLEKVKNAGGIPVILPLELTEEDVVTLNDHIDGYIFTGGDDVNPAIYDEDKLPHCGDINHLRDELEMKVFKAAYDANKPILGVCRGFQLINSLLGGKLYQDLIIEFGGINHRMERPYSNYEHYVKVLENTPLHNIAGDKMGANSCHHQGIKVLSNELAPMAVSEDGLIEAFYAPERSYLWGFQWHPEMLVDESSQKVFDKLIESARG